MSLIPKILSTHNELTAWRHDLHAHPELAFSENRTSVFVADKLNSWGIEVTQGFGKTGVVGTLKVGASNKSIGLRADMDALPMDELNTFAHKSKHPGCMHGCGHDGHTVMLLAAAWYLAQSKKFDGTVQFIFQPAEEANDNGSGARAMINDGLFDRFPMDSIFAMHNMPGLPEGTFSIGSGPVFAAMDLFDVTITGKGTHGALPHTGIDTVLVCSHVITAWQSIVSRNIDPMQTAVFSATSIQAGDNWNVIPQTAVIKGSVRTFLPEVQALVRERLHAIAEQVASAFGATAQVDYRQELPATVNDAEQASQAVVIAKDLVGEEKIKAGADAIKLMGSEDFSVLLQYKPGAYLLLGSGAGEGVCMVHEARYDFNDNLLPIGASFFARLVEQKLA